MYDLNEGIHCHVLFCFLFDEPTKCSLFDQSDLDRLPYYVGISSSLLSRL